MPNALADLFKGEQQKNVDFALLKALQVLRIDPDQGILFIYDIVCQYIIYLLERIGHLLPPGLNIDQAIDLFHVHGHKDECFFRYVTTFIPGAAVVAGQIIESLWSNLNSISPTVRTATLPHRAEMLDDHACDSNHKKMLAMTDNLCTRYRDATTMSTQADAYYLDIARSVDREIIATWEDEVKTAETLRQTDIKAMDIYAARLTDRMVAHPAATAPASPHGAASATVDQWLEYALVVEEAQ